jgi:hypothetical protein
MSYTEDAYQRQFEAWQEQEREWYDLCCQLEHEGYIHVQFARAHERDVHDWLRARYGEADAYCFYDQAMVKTDKDALWVQLNWCK